MIKVPVPHAIRRIPTHWLVTIGFAIVVITLLAISAASPAGAIPFGAAMLLLIVFVGIAILWHTARRHRPE